MQNTKLVVVDSGLGNQHGVEVGSSYAAAALPGAPQGSAPPISTANQVPAGQRHSYMQNLHNTHHVCGQLHVLPHIMLVM